MKTWALVTGASGGIGLDLARECAADGMSLVLVSRDEKKLSSVSDAIKKTSPAIETKVLPCDLSEPGAAASLYEKVKALGISVDVLVNNAGVGASGAFAENDPREITSLLNLNVVALTDLTRLFLPEMIARGRGRILNVASTAAFQPMPYFAAYAATKSYVLSISEALSEELSGTGVSVTCLCPGATETGFATAAHMTDSKIFAKGVAADSRSVARAGFAALKAGRRTVVVGTANWAMTKLVSWLPRRLVLKSIKRLMTP